jgi:peroxiredoxin
LPAYLLCVIFLQMNYLRSEWPEMARSATAVWLRAGLLLCALAVPRFAYAGGPATHCADNEQADGDANAAQTASATPTSAPRPTLVGGEAPDFTLKDVTGRDVHLRDLRGNVVVLDFWSSECPSSRAAMPYLQQLHDQYGEKELAVLGLNIGEDAAHVAEFARDAVFTFPLLVGADPDVTTKYSVTAYPMAFVVDRNGKIAFAGSPTDEPGALLHAVKNAVARRN